MQFRPAFYHAAMRSVLFTLPFEFEALFYATPKPSARGLEQVSKTLHDGAVLVTAPLAEGHGCNSSFLNSVSEAASLLNALATLSGLTSLGELSHQFQPFGVTATWPEHGYAVMDLVSCKPIEAKAIDDVRTTILETLKCAHVALEVSFRGPGAEQLLEATRWRTHSARGAVNLPLFRRLLVSNIT